MKVLMLGRIGLLEHGGGDKVQIQNTASELSKLGVDVTISTNVVNDYAKYDVIHIFQMDWTPESYFYAKEAAKHQKPIILSPIHHNVLEVKRFDEKYAFGFRRVSKALFKDQHNRDTFKNVYRSVFDPRKIPSTLHALLKGLKFMHQETLKKATKVLVQTNKEASDLIDTYSVKIDWVKVPNGVSNSFLNPTSSLSNLFEFENYILCVGRVEPRKNQLSILAAVKKIRDELKQDIKLVFVGSKSTQRHIEYLHWFHKEIKTLDWVYCIEKIPYEQMPQVYKFAKVGVSASWFETTGLTSLEALFCGTNAVAAGDRAKEYLETLVSYCDPGNIESIKDAIKKEYLAPRPTIPEKWRYDYTWANAAQKTLQVYNEVCRL